MGLFDKVEKGLERTVNRAFAKAFRSEVQPVEIAGAIRNAMDDRASVLGPGRTMVPNHYTIELSTTDFGRLDEYSDSITEDLIAAAAEHAETQRYLPGGPIEIVLAEGSDLDTGVFRVRPETSKRGQASGMPPAPVPAPPHRPAAPVHKPAPVRAPAPAAPPAAPPAPPAAQAPAPSPQPAPDALAAPDLDAGHVNAGHVEPPEVIGDWANELSHPAYDASSHVADPDVELLPDRALAPDQPAVAPPPPPPLAAPPPAPAPAPPAKLPRINPAQRPWLDIDGERYPLLGSLTVIGRDATADVILDDPGISRRHSEVRVTHDGPHLVSSIRDLASTNGTFVNGERIASTRLIDGDQITVGRTAITFRAGKR
jgi:hypothetical protein